MRHEEFLREVLDKVSKEENVPKESLFFVWTCKTLQNSKAILASTTGLFIEATMNGDDEVIYLDYYSKYKKSKIECKQ